MKWILILLCWLGVGGTTEVSNFTYDKEMSAKCKQHICRNGYIYDAYYRIDSNERKPVDPKVAFEMHIAIQAASNGHILLSPVEHAGFSDPVYEIVVGGGGNTFTELRRNLRRNAKASAKTIGILSSAELRGFYIKITKDGQVEFGREGELLPIISIYDVDPLDISYFSFASWTGVDARFLYDCPAPGTDDKPHNSTEVDDSSSSEKLKRKILASRFPSIPPAQNMTVEVGTMLISARYDSFDAKLITDLAFVTSWKDKNVAWDPDKYNGTTRLNFRQTQIWRPTFLVYNANTLDPLDANNAGLITMDYSGESIFHFRTTVESWCVVDDSTSLNKWPMDSYDCIVVIRPFQVHELINLKLLKLTDVKMKFYTDIDIKVKNEWETTATSLVFSSQQWFKLHNTVNDATESDVMVIYVTMQRRAVALNIAIYTPLVVLVTFVLMSFWSEPLTMSRIWFYAGSAATISLGLCYIEYIMPCHNMPSLLVLYTTVLGGILIALLLQVILMTSLVKTVCETQPMQNLLTSQIFRKIFLLSPMTTVTKNYDTLNEGFSYEGEEEIPESSRSVNIEEMVPDATEKTTFGDAAELAEAFDKLLFFVYSLVFAVLLALHF